jgi:hypothetical protein
MSHGDAISSQLPSDRLGEIHFGSAAQVMTLRKPRFELNRNLRPNLKATCANPRPDGDDQIFGPAAKAISHSLRRFRNYTQDCPPPAGVNGCHSAMAGVSHKDWQAIRRADGQRNSRAIGDEGVAFPKATCLCRGHDQVRVYLSNAGEAGGVRPSGTDTSAEAMFQPGQVAERLGAIDVTAVEGKQSPVYRLCNEFRRPADPGIFLLWTPVLRAAPVSPENPAFPVGGKDRGNLSSN